MGYGQDYYTLRSIFMDGIPPPAIHIHLRMFDVVTGVPLGDISTGKPSIQQPSQNKDIDIPDGEKEKFDVWLRELWQEKDDSMTKFSETTSFGSRETRAVEIPLKLRRKREVLDAFCFFLPAGIVYLWGKLRQ
jgi:hypothetical protein